MFFYFTLCVLSVGSFAQTSYYKCVTEKGTTFSQLPCGNNATLHKISTPANTTQLGPKVDYIKQLNGLERERIIANLQAEVRSNQHKLAILARKHDQANFKQQQRINRILSEDEKKRISRDIIKQQKLLEKHFKQDAALITKKIKELEHTIKSYLP